MDDNEIFPESILTLAYHIALAAVTAVQVERNLAEVWEVPDDDQENIVTAALTGSDLFAEFPEEDVNDLINSLLYEFSHVRGCHRFDHCTTRTPDDT